MPEITEKVTVTSVDRVRISEFMAPEIVYGASIVVKGATMSAEFTVPMAEAAKYTIGTELRLVAVVPE